jgi:hypothetical protein
MQIGCYIMALFPPRCVFLVCFASPGIGNVIFNIGFGSRVDLHTTGMNGRLLIRSLGISPTQYLN